MSSRANARLLLSCRDPGGALQIAPLAREAGRGGWSVTVVADQPALNIVRGEGIAAIEAGIGEVSPGDRVAANRALQRAEQIRDEYAPDVVIASSSGPDAGIDEALIAVHEQSRTCVLQDSWGDINEGFGVHAGHYFVLDSEADALTRHRVSSDVVVTGMPKYDAYARIDVARERARVRRAMGVEGGRAVISFFAQPLNDTPGYGDLVTALVDAVAALERSPHLVLRAHPKDRTGAMVEAGRRAVAARVSCHVSHEGAVEPLLAASDVVVSAFSTCCYDAIVMNAAAHEPVNASLYFMTEPVLQTYRSIAKLDPIPPVQAGMARFAGSAAELRTQLNAALDTGRRRELWNRIRATLPAPSGASARILTRVASMLELRTPLRARC